MAYEDQTAYAKHLKSTLTADGGCEGCGQAAATFNCDCCPPGLVKTTGLDGVSVGCLTPADAAQYIKDTRTCPQGFIALYKTATSEFMGCVSESNYIALNAAVNP